MSDSLAQVERQLALLSPGAVPNKLREEVLAGMRRELRASRWDRRLGRVATFVLLIGVGMNAVMALGMSDGRHLMGKETSRNSLLQTAVAVALATDVETGRQVAQQLAAWSGQVMTDEQVAAFEAALAAELRKGNDG